VNISFRLVRKVVVDHVERSTMSRPRAAMSVATRTRIVPFLKAERAFSLAPCDLSPWIASTRTPERLQDPLHAVRAVPRPCEHEAFLISSSARSAFRSSALEVFST